jgi:serine/threonine-protein kinase
MGIIISYGSRRLTIRPGETCAVGRGGSDRPVWIKLSDAEDLSRVACAISVIDGDLWVLEAPSVKNGVRVQHPATGSLLTVPAGQTLPMPAFFDDVYVVIHTPTGEYSLSVRGGNSGDLGGPVPSASDRETVMPLRPDPELGYVRALVALCEPRLRDPFETSVPTESQIAARLAASGRDPGCDRRSVMKRLERARALVGAASNRELRDRMVDSGALTPEHLAILDRGPA